MPTKSTKSKFLWEIRQMNLNPRNVPYNRSHFGENAKTRAANNAAVKFKLNPSRTFAETRKKVENAGDQVEYMGVLVS